MPTPERSTATTPDGRTLTFVELGDPVGSPVLHHHGGLLSATDVAPLHDVASAAGVRLISFDRPGIAGSDPMPGRTTRDGATDAAAVLDHLGLDEVRVTGWSMGGQYALATCAGLGRRVVAAAVVAGCVPIDDAAALEEIDAMDRRFTAMAEHHRLSLEKVALLWGGLARFSPRGWARATARGQGEADTAAIEEYADELAASAHATAQQRAGIVEEYLAWARSWGFAYVDVAQRVDVWQGTDDHLVPPEWAERIAASLPDARLRTVEGGGHFLLHEHGAQILEALLEPVSEPA
jgi:pimeloyl-ACP methyl ester carboxylesterase